MRFSQRIGKRPIKTVLQVESIDDDLKNRLWNTILDFFKRLDTVNGYPHNTEFNKVGRLIWKEFFKKPIDEFPNGTAYIREWFYSVEWFEIYDFIEFIALVDKRAAKTGFIEACNWALAKEVAGYRIVNESVVQITSEEEVQEIEEATLNSKKWNSVHTHLGAALNLLADRKTPDYRNSIKESISAVEALCRIITNNETTTLGKALAVIEKKHSLHAALKSAFSAIYGYTSDSGGIRHALLETDAKVGFEEAKFMLVSCSAFINYLKTKMKV